MSGGRVLWEASAAEPELEPEPKPDYKSPPPGASASSAAPVSSASVSSAPPSSSALGRERGCEIAVVGGGFTGLSAALHAAEKGADVRVFEAGRIGGGASGRSAGLVNPGLWLAPQDVRGVLGAERAAALTGLMGDMPDYVFSLIEKHQIRCEAVRRGAIHAAHSPGGMENLRRRAGEWRRLGAPAQLLGPEQTAEKTGARGFYGGLLDKRAGTVNPAGLVRGLARAAAAAGARISAGVRVKKLTRAKGRWILGADAGEVTAGKVILAANAYTDNLCPGLRRTFTKIHYFQLATEPLGARAAHILKDGQGLWTTDPVMLSLRRDAAGRLIIGSMGRALGGTGGLARRWAERRLARFFPALGPVRFEHAWSGAIAMTPDRVFKIHRPDEGLYTPIGYNGRGITAGVMFGRALAELLTGGGEAALPVPVTAPRPVRARAAKEMLLDAAFAANQIWKGF